MKIFQYKILKNKLFKKSIITEEEFNRLGKQGWELASTSLGDEGILQAFFKKEI